MSPRKRAEDIILGALGYGEEASILSIQESADGFSGTAQWPDGEQFLFRSDDIPSELEQWALKILREA